MTPAGVWCLLLWEARSLPHPAHGRGSGSARHYGRPPLSRSSARPVFGAPVMPRRPAPERDGTDRDPRASFSTCQGIEGQTNRPARRGGESSAPGSVRSGLRVREPTGSYTALAPRSPTPALSPRSALSPAAPRRVLRRCPGVNLARRLPRSGSRRSASAVAAQGAANNNEPPTGCQGNPAGNFSSDFGGAEGRQKPRRRGVFYRADL